MSEMCHIPAHLPPGLIDTICAESVAETTLSHAVPGKNFLRRDLSRRRIVVNDIVCGQ